MELLSGFLVFATIAVVAAAFGRRSYKLELERQLLQRITQPVFEERAPIVDITREVVRSRHWWGHLWSKLGLSTRLEQFLLQAGIYTPAADLMMLSVILTAVGVAVGAAFSAGGVVSYGIDSMIFGSLPFLYVLWRRQRRLRAFDRQLPDMLDMLRASLDAGHTLQRALQVAVEEFAEPAAGELRIVLEQNSLGIPLDQSLELMLQRVPDDNLRFLVTAVKIQAQSGSSLGHIIGQLASTVRDRHRIAMKVRVLTAQPKITGIVAGLSPILLLLGMHFVSPDHVHMLFNDPAGRQITKAAFGFELTAFLVIYRMLQVDY